jgi:hypothetical protein
MIGGTAVQTLILAIITVRCDWEKEVSYMHSFSISSSTNLINWVDNSSFLSLWIEC